MDNDFILVKKAKKIIKNTKFRLDYRGINILSDEEGNREIYNLLCKEKPFAVVRGGATELRCVKEYISHTDFFSDKIKKEISELSGVFPADNETLGRFCKYYSECIDNADVQALWGVGAESILVKKDNSKSKIYCNLRSLEPYYFSEPWSKALTNKRVLIIHPFSNSIINQYKKRELLFENKNILPEFKSLECIKAVQSIANEKTEFASWFDALDYMKQQISQKDFDVAIIGAGAYGLPLAIHCKELGKQAIQMSGATQILFGIKGKRWDNHPVISKLYNEHWIRPDLNETPKGAKKVEGGSYW